MTTSAVQSPNAVPAAVAEERWYLRIDGHDYGPVPRAALEEFLRPPRLCSVMEVKCGGGTWFTIARHESIDKVLAKFGIEHTPASGPAAETVPQPSTQPKRKSATTPSSRLSSRVAWLRDFLEGLVAWLIYHWIATSLVALYLLGNALFLVSTGDPHVADRQVLARYEELWKQVRAFETDETPRAAWQAFAGSAVAELTPIVRRLERSAGVHQPTRQNLLFAGREHLLKMLKGERPPSADAIEANLFERRLRLAREQLSGEGAARDNSTARSKSKGAS